VIAHFPQAPGLLQNAHEYMVQIDEKYAQDAYNSLSIEGYQVSKELIERVMDGFWSPDNNLQDMQQKDALAARGYYEAYLVVKNSVEKILKGKSLGDVIQADLPRWYQKLFSPAVQAGMLSASELFGYRRHQVYIRHSRHTPPSKEYLGELMETLFLRLKNEEHAGVRAVLGHFIFVYIHPYMDGNGRIGRFLMNAMLASGGYPWAIVHVAHRNQYLAALESASVDGDILPFTKFIASEMSDYLLG
jgi:Fic family protein